jgi:hypothetical protein
LFRNVFQFRGQSLHEGHAGSDALSQIRDFVEQRFRLRRAKRCKDLVNGREQSLIGAGQRVEYDKELRGFRSALAIAAQIAIRGTSASSVTPPAITTAALGPLLFR